MFKKILASVGIGAAKVDTILQTEHLLPGQRFHAEIVIKGGDAPQELSGLELALMTKAKVESDNGSYFKNQVIQQWHLSDRKTIQPGKKSGCLLRLNCIQKPLSPNYRCDIINL